MNVVYDEFYYQISLSDEEIARQPTFLSNYEYQSGYFIPKLLKGLPLRLDQGCVLHTMVCLKTSTYPYYITNSKYHIGWSGILEPLIPKPHTAVETTVNTFLIHKPTTVVAPNDIIITASSKFIIKKPLAFEYTLDDKIKEITLYNR